MSIPEDQLKFIQTKCTVSCCFLHGPGKVTPPCLLESISRIQERKYRQKEIFGQKLHANYNDLVIYIINSFFQRFRQLLDYRGKE